MRCHFLLQGIFPIQRSNLCLLRLRYWQVGSLSLRHLGSPNIVYEICRNDKWGRYTIQLIFLKIFWCVLFFEVFIEFFAILFLFNVLVFWPQDMSDLWSLARDQTHTPCIGRQSLQPWTSQGSPHSAFILWSVPNTSGSWQYRNTDWNHCCRHSYK